MSDADAEFDSGRRRATGGPPSLDAAAAAAVRTDVLGRCRALGFAAAGVADLAPLGPRDRAALGAWLDAGMHGDMAWLEERRELLAAPAEVLPGARAAICVADRYAEGRPDPRDPGTGRVARYARGDDYHRVIKKRLFALADALAAAHPGHAFKAAVDTAPLLERVLAVRAGLGRIGKHTLLIGEGGLGSWLLLGQVLTTLPLADARSDAASATAATGTSSDVGGRPPHESGTPFVPPAERTLDPCGACTRCIDACPTDAITPWRVDATRCVSYLTIEHRGPIDPALHAGHEDWLFGCDTCQAVCPHDRRTRRSRRHGVHPAYASRDDRDPGFGLLEVLGWTEEDRRAACVTSAMKRAKLDMLHRNAAIAAGNAIASGALDPAHAGRLRDRLAAIAADEDAGPLARDAARTVLARAAVDESD